MTQPQVPVLTIKMVPAGVELVLMALNQLPRAQSDALFIEIRTQAEQQLQQYQSLAAEQVTDLPEQAEQEDEVSA